MAHAISEGTSRRRRLVKAPRSHRRRLFGRDAGYAPSLEYMILEQNQISDVGVRALAVAIRTCKSPLNKITLDGNPCSEEAQRELQQALESIRR